MWVVNLSRKEKTCNNSKTWGALGGTGSLSFGKKEIRMGTNTER